jgi:phosphatidate cytidylyltransferase
MRLMAAEAPNGLASETPMTNSAMAPKPPPGDRDAHDTPGSRPGRMTLRGRMTDLGPRIASGLVLVAGAIVTLLSGGLVFLLAWLAATLIVHLEWQRLIGGVRLALRLAAGTLAISGAGFLAHANGVGFALLVLGLGALANAYLAEPGRRAWSAAGIVYAGSLIVSVSVLRGSFPFGARAVGWLFAVVWGTDVVAYFAGRLIGGPRFAPLISPSKTWAGTICGMIGGASLGSLFLILAAHVSRLETPAPFYVLFLLGLITSAIAQGGDLFESWAKRCFGVKDSGGLIPGHGGLMDRLDGFIAAATFVAILGALRGFPSPAEGLFHWM